MATNHYLPSKAHSFLARIQAEHVSDGKTTLSDILDASRVFVVQETSYDNLDGGTYGHDVILFMPPEQLGKIRIKEQKPISDEICGDLNACAASYDNEFFRTVVFEANDEDDARYQQSIPIAQRPTVNPDRLRIWKQGQIRLFISHRDTHKVQAKALGMALEGYGISSFVAHDTIEPMSTWVHEIRKGLQTMEIMLAFVTDDFHASDWTNQEIGYALGREVPIISLKLQKEDPRGFIGSQQALKGRLEDVSASVTEIYGLIADRLGNGKRLQTGLISALIESPDFIETKLRFDRLESVTKSLTDSEVERIAHGFRTNDQMHNCTHLTSRYKRLKKFLEHCTGRRYEIKGLNISTVVINELDEVLF